MFEILPYDCLNYTISFLTINEKRNLKNTSKQYNKYTTIYNFNSFKLDTLHIPYTIKCDNIVEKHTSKTLIYTFGNYNNKIYPKLRYINGYILLLYDNKMCYIFTHNEYNDFKNIKDVDFLKSLRYNKCYL